MSRPTLEVADLIRAQGNRLLGECARNDPGSRSIVRFDIDDGNATRAREKKWKAYQKENRLAGPPAFSDLILSAELRALDELTLPQ